MQHYFKANKRLMLLTKLETWNNRVNMPEKNKELGAARTEDAMINADLY